MKTTRLTFLALALLLIAAPLAYADSSGRERINFDAGWRFHLGDLSNDSSKAITLWKWKTVERNAVESDRNASPDTDFGTEVWNDAKPGEDTFHGRRGLSWYRTVLPDLPGPNRMLHFESVDDIATVYVNGKKLARHEGWSDAFDVPVDSVWKEGGPNVAAVLVENTANAGGIGAAAVQKEFDAATSGPAAVAYDDKDWRKIHLPHDFVVEGTFTPTANASHGSLPTDVGWYRKTFAIPADDKGKSLWLDFDGIYRDSRVWLNGKLLGRHKSGYIGVRYDITDKVNYGSSNTLVVRCDARAQEGWWYEGGGIYRHVWLNKANPVHIAPDGVFVVPTLKNDSEAMVDIKVALENSSDKAAKIRLFAAIVEPDGRSKIDWTTDKTLEASGEQTLPNRFYVTAPKLWSLENPSLYHLKVQIQQDGKVLDSFTVPFGIRTIKFDADKGFFLNGKPVKIQGVCNHQDFAGVGTAMPDSLLEWRIWKLKEMGCNAYRMSHNPPAPELLDACDRLGMLVMDETRHLGDATGPKTGHGTKFDDLGELKSMVKRDRNHPSIIIWSMCNEEGLQGSDEGATIFAAMKKVTEELDGTRPVSCAMNGGWGAGISLVEDLQGCNYNPRGYDAFHARVPKLPMYGSETASEVGTRGEYANDREKGYVSAYSVNAPPWAQTCEVAWKALADRPFMAGGFVWTGFDYKGEPTPYGWPCVNSHFGIMDECGFPKDAYYYYQAWWGDKPIVHVFPHWNWTGKEGQPIDVWVHSNAEKVELFLNGASLGSKEMPRDGHLAWTVNYAPGKLEAKGYTNGKLVASDVVETTGEAAQIKLSPNATTLKADGEEVVMVEVDVLDAKGRIVPYADNNVVFTVTGAGVVGGVGNGDPSDHDPDKANHRKAFHGKCMVIVQAGESGGKIELTANAPGLKPAKITLNAVTVRRVGKNEKPNFELK